MKKIFAVTIICSLLILLLSSCNSASTGSSEGPSGKDGADGVSIIDAKVVGDSLWITYSNDPDNPVNVGKVNDYSLFDFEGIGAIPTTSSPGLEFRTAPDGKSYVVTGIGSCSDEEIVIDTYNGLPVSAIADKAFENMISVKKVTLGPSVKAIGSYAFSCCFRLESISLPDGLTRIGDSAFFSSNAMKSLDIPDSVVRMGKVDINQKYIEIENGIHYLSKWVVGCDSSVETAVLREDTVGIANEAFLQAKNIKSVSLPKSLKSIGYNAFGFSSNLETLDIPDSLINMGYSAFNENTKATVSDGTLLYIDNWVLKHFTESATVSIKSGTVGIAESAFEYSISLDTVSIPLSVKHIGDRAFFNCHNLSTICFEGTIEQWKAITKGEKWNYNNGIYTVVCSNGKIAKVDS